MKQSSQPRFVIGLIVLAVLCTVALELQERRSAPLSAYSPASPARTAPQTQAWASRARTTVRQIGMRAFWLRPWPWIVAGLVGFGLLAWGVIWGTQRTERD
jgi:hypothetical protein